MYLATGLLASACGGDPPDTDAMVRLDSAGLTIVVSGSVDRALDWTFEETFRLGGAPSGPESFYHVLPETVGVDGEDRIYILDIVAQQVAVFSAGGEYLRKLGAPGRGPREIAEAAGLYVAPDGTVEVYDFGKAGLVRFSPTGVPLEEERFTSAIHGRFVRQDEALLVSWTDRRSVPDSIVDRLDAVRDRDTISLATIVKPHRPRVQFPICNTVPFVLEPVFEPKLVWTANRERLAVAAVYEYRVDVFKNLEHTLSIRRAIAPRDASRALAVRHLGRGLPTEQHGQDLCYVPADQVVDQVGFAAWVPVIAHVAIAPDGTLWVSRMTIGGSPENIDVFAADGKYLGTLPEGSPRPLTFLSDGTLLASELDALDVERLVAYAVHRRNAP